MPVSLSISYLFLPPLDISMQATKSSLFILSGAMSCHMFIMVFFLLSFLLIIYPARLQINIIMIICLAFESVLKKAERYNIISEERSEVFEKKRKIRFAETEKGCPWLADRGRLDIPARACLRQQFAVRRGGRTCRRNSGVHYRLGQPEQNSDAPCRGVRDTYLCGKYDRRPRRDALLHYCGYAPALCRNYSVQ